jgi:uncharacterized protein (TIGR00290 family)
MSIKAFCYWNGGEDSCLSYDRAVNEGIAVNCLFSMPDGNKADAFSRALPEWVLERQANSMRIRIVYRKAGSVGEKYEERYVSQLRLFREQGYDIGVFDDIDAEERKKWSESLCAEAALKVILPLWRIPRRRVVNEFIGLGYQAIVVAVKRSLLPVFFLGRAFDDEMISDLKELGVNPYADRGAFRTFVVDGPVFRHRVRFNVDGIEERDGCAYLKLVP